MSCMREPKERLSKRCNTPPVHRGYTRPKEIGCLRAIGLDTDNVTIMMAGCGDSEICNGGEPARGLVRNGKLSTLHRRSSQPGNRGSVDASKRITGEHVDRLRFLSTNSVAERQNKNRCEQGF